MSEGGNFVAFAAGQGMVPVLPIVETLLSRNASAHVQVFYGDRTRDKATAAEALLALKDRYMNRLALHFVMSDEPQEIELLNGQLDVDKVAAVAGKLFDPKGVRQYILCGPGTMSSDIGNALQKLGVDARHIHVESYSANAVTAQPADQAVASIASNRAEVAVIMDGRRRTFTMRLNEDTILEAAAEAGIDLPFSCKAGVCSTCRTKLVRGNVDLAQNYALEDWELEQGFILACQAHVKTPEIEITYDES